ncbi:MAG: ABC transporter permease [Bacteroidetes bacterium]|nr:ABC transporter permease [Bacteroidota bacterium]
MKGNDHNRFDLETAIATWRHSIKLRKVLLDEDLDELEQHIRDQVRTLRLTGHDEESAFRKSIRQMGEHSQVEEAYRRVYWAKLRRKGLLTTTLISEAAMLSNYVTIALRNLRRYPGYTFINIAGLAVGIACCLLIVLFVQDEIAFDRYHDKADNIIRVTLFIPELEREIEVTPTIVGPMFKRTIPEVEDATRLYDIGSRRITTIRRGIEAWHEDGFMYADSTVFNVFTFPFLLGTPEAALNRPNTVVLTESAARKYFGEPTEALGGLLTIGSAGDFEVTGVIENIPSNSHIQFNVLASFVSTHWASEERWDSANFYTYLLLAHSDALPSLRVKIDEQLAIAKAQMGLRDNFELGLQRFTDIYLVHMGRQKYVWLFTALALLILGVACVNYINLSTARSSRRGREVGMRKVLGAHRGQLARQFFGESALFSVLAFLLGLGLAALLLPMFNTASAKNLSFDALAEPQMWAVMVGLLVIITIGAGIFPSLVLSGFRPAIVLNGGYHAGAGKNRLRKVLVSFQFMVTVFMLIGATVIYHQLRFIQTADLGFNRDQVVVIPLPDASTVRNLPSYSQTVLQNSNVIHASAFNSIPGAQRGGYGLYEEGKSWDENDILRIAASQVDHSAIQTLEFNLLAGPGFKEPANYLTRPDSGQYQYLVNESLVRAAGWTTETTIGKRMSVSGNGRMGEVVGVIRDYNFLTLRDEMHPLALFIEPSWTVLLVKISPQNIPNTLRLLESSWDGINTGSPFSYTFLDDDYAAFYQTERRLGQIFGGAALLAVLIACLGLFGLASFTAEQRTKEIGIRKVMGANVPGLIAMLNKDFTILVLIGFAIAVPLAWWTMTTWLEGFAFRIDLAWWIFAIAGGLALVIAWISVSFQSLRVATTNPVNALRYE